MFTSSTAAPCFIFLSLSIGFVWSHDFVSDVSFLAGRNDWDDITSAGLQLPHHQVWPKIQFHSFLDFLFRDVIGNYSALSKGRKNVTFHSGEWFDVRLIESNAQYKYIIFGVQSMSPAAITDGFVPSSLVFFLQVSPWIGKEKELSILRTGYKLQGGSQDHNLHLQATNFLSAIIRSCHDTARAQLGAYPCNNEFRTFTGTCNNPNNYGWGAAQTALRRIGDRTYDPAFVPGTNNYPVANMPNPRVVSRTLFRQHESKPNARKVTVLAVFFGQFIDHDIGLTPNSEHTVFEERMDISINDSSDPFYQRHGGVLQFTRSRGVADGRPCCGNGIEERFPRDPINSQSSFIDASHVYGCQRDRIKSLRMWKNGKLQTGRRFVAGQYFLPKNGINEIGMKLENEGSDSGQFFVAGDSRANEQPVLTSLHTLFVREHNRIAELLKKQFSCWSEEKIYQYSRKIVTAQMQYFTYQFFLPALLGHKFGLSKYTGYKPNVDPSIANFFSTVAFRFGHSMVPDKLTILESGRKPHEKSGMHLHEAFFDPTLITEVGIEEFLLGASHQIAEAVDTQVVNSLQNELFRSITGGVDLITLNIQRGRDHGLPKYNNARRMYGLLPKSSFREITSNATVAKLLYSLYGSVDEIDSYVGGLAEDPLPDSELGELFHTAVREQFEQLRDGDRFFYESLVWPTEVSRIEPVLELTRNTLTLQRLIVRNGGNKVKELDFAPDVFRLS